MIISNPQLCLDFLQPQDFRISETSAGQEITYKLHSTSTAQCSTEGKHDSTSTARRSTSAKRHSTETKHRLASTNNSYLESAHPSKPSQSHQVQQNHQTQEPHYLSQPHHEESTARVGEIRIPALAEISGQLFAFFEVRPQLPGALNGDVFTGKTLASDLPNPNQIFLTRIRTSANQHQHQHHPSGSSNTSAKAELDTDLELDTAPVLDTALYLDTERDTDPGLDPDFTPRPLRTHCPEMPEISSDAAVAVDNIAGEIHIAFASTPKDSAIGYFDSCYDGPRLIPGLVFGPSLEQLQYRELSELYELLKSPEDTPLKPDALFATSGSSITWNGRALIPYVARKGNATFVYVVHLQAGEILAVSKPIFADEAQLDETTLAIADGKIWLNARVQGFLGRGAGVRFLAQSTDGIYFSQPLPWLLADPGCNAKQLGNMFIHPHSASARERGAIVRVPELSQLQNAARVGKAQARKAQANTPQTSATQTSAVQTNKTQASAVQTNQTRAYTPQANTPQILATFGDTSFGYCDALHFAQQLYVLFEHDGGLALGTFTVT